METGDSSGERTRRHHALKGTCDSQGKGGEQRARPGVQATSATQAQDTGQQDLVPAPQLTACDALRGKAFPSLPSSTFTLRGKHGGSNQIYYLFFVSIPRAHFFLFPVISKLCHCNPIAVPESLSHMKIKCAVHKLGRNTANPTKHPVLFRQDSKHLPFTS